MPSIATHRRQLVVAVTVLATVLGTGWAASTAAPGGSQPTTLSSQLDRLLADSRLAGAEAALSVTDADTGEQLYQANGAERLLPASTAKVLTSVASMDLLGPDYRFRTAVLRTGRLTGHALLGNLYLKGFGDPMSTAADYDALAAQVAAAGVREVRGSLVADDSYFDTDRLAPFWSWDDEPYYYSAQTSALNIAPDTIGDTGTILLNVYPGAHPGDRPSVTVTPANHYVRIVNLASTAAAGAARTISAVREHGKNVVDVTGRIPADSAGYAAQPTVDDPTGLVADVFGQALARHGVRLAHRAVDRSTAPAGAVTIASRQSIRLAELLTPFLKLSNNMIAEALTKAIGQRVSGQGGWAAGTAAILADAGSNAADPATLQLFDGSGLGRADYLTTDQLSALLVRVRTKAWFQTWYDALPIAGNPAQLVGGTLRHRLTGTVAANNLHGKTGSMTGVSALAGYLTDAAGHHLVFAMLANNFVQGGVTAIEDAVALTLAEHGAAAPASVRPAGTAPAQTGRQAQLECAWVRSC